MKSNLSLTILLFLLILLLGHTGCVTTTQKGTAIGAGTGAGVGALIGSVTGNAGMGAAIGAGVGALGGALVGDSIDQKREEREKAEIQRKVELEGRGSKKSDYYQELEAQQSERKYYSNVIKSKEENEDLFVRNWQDDHWVYTPTNNPDETNLFRRVKSKDGRWDYIPIINKQDVGSRQDQHPQDIEAIKKEVGGDEDKPIYSHIKSRSGLNSEMEVQPQTSIYENERVKKARKELEKELEAIRKKNKQ